MMQTLTPQEKTAAALCHFSGLVIATGLFIPAIIWAENRGKSRYVAYHAMQAYGYQSLGYTLWMLLYLLFFTLVLIGLTIVGLLGANAGNNDTILALISFLLMSVGLGLIGLYALFPVIAGVSCLLGRDYHYPLLGSRFATFLAADEDVNAEKWLASMGHFSVIIPLWGLIAPAYLWLTQPEGFLKRQSAQTTLYQLWVNFLYILTAIVSGIFVAVGIVIVSASSQVDISSLVVLLAFTCLLAVFVLVVPLFHILGQWAGIQVLRGVNYQYPVIHRFIKK